jgi:nucleotide-binding universal stress UspA family protein
MFEKILVPVDGSSVSAQALPVAAVLTDALQSKLTLLRVLDSPKDAFVPDRAGADMSNTSRYFDSELRLLASQNVAAECTIQHGKPAAAIMDYAKREHMGLIVMATHGRSGLTRMVFGSVTDAVVEHCKIPLLVVRATEPSLPTGTRIRRILVPLDGSELAESAIGHAAAIARPLGADVVLFSIWDTFGYELTIYPRDEIEAEMHEKHAAAKQYLIAQTEKLTAQGISARWQLKSGLVVDEIIGTANKQDVDLIIMSTHARHGFDRWVEGTVAGEVLLGSPVPVMLIRSTEDALAQAALQHA